MYRHAICIKLFLILLITCGYNLEVVQQLYIVHTSFKNLYINHFSMCWLLSSLSSYLLNHWAMILLCSIKYCFILHFVLFGQIAKCTNLNLNNAKVIWFILHSTQDVVICYMAYVMHYPQFCLLCTHTIGHPF